MIKKIVKNSLFLVLIAGALNVASAQETKSQKANHQTPTMA